MRKIFNLCATLCALCFALTACAQNKKTDKTESMDKKTLVAYFSATGTTKHVAEMIAQKTGAELYAIEPTETYTAADLDWTDKKSRSCYENDHPESRPAFHKTKASLDDYDVIYLGYPIWWDLAPRIINTFVETYGLKGKTIIPFATSGGSTITNSVKVLKKTYPDINWQTGHLLNNASADDIEAIVK